MKKERHSVALVVPWNSTGVAGAEQQVVLLAQHLNKEKFDPFLIVITTQLDFDHTVIPQELSYELIVAKRTRNAFWSLLKVLRKRPPDSVISNTVSASALSAVVLLFLRQKIKHIAINHGTDFTNWKQRLEIRLTYLLIHAYIVVSDGIRQHMEKLFSRPVSVTVVPNMFDFSDIATLSTGPLPKTTPPRYFVYVGRLENHQKAVDVLLTAWKEVEKSNQDRQLLLLGDGPDRTSLERLCTTLGLTRVTFLGWQENPYPYIQQAEALVLPSRYEGFGRVLVEALYLGTPVISTDCPSGPAEILQNGAFGTLVPVSDQAALSTALATHDPAVWDRLLLKHRAEKYSYQIILPQYEKIILA